MLCCGFNPTCSWEASCSSRNCCETAGRDVKEGKGEIVEGTDRMDIALLREQYNWIKEKQKLQTQVVVFSQADDPAISSGQSLVNVFPVYQEMKNTPERKLFVSEGKMDLFVELERDPWRRHLGEHRQTNSIIPTDPNPTDSSSTSSSLTSLTDDHEKIYRDYNSVNIADMSTSNIISDSQKCAGLSVPSRRLSLGDQGPSLVHSSSLYYPFPKRKGPNKSEAARRLGMYASF